MTRAEIETKIATMAIKDFSDHVVRYKPGPHHWVLQKKDNHGWTSIFAVDIICLGTSGSLFVGGDIGPVVFAYGPGNFEQRISWVGHRPPPDHYVASKASIGTGQGGRAERDADLARVEILEILEEEARNDPEFDKKAALEELQVAMSYLSDSFDLFYYELPEEYYETLEGVGEHISSRVIFAHAAVHRLWQLITEGKADPVENIPERFTE